MRPEDQWRPQGSDTYPAWYPHTPRIPTSALAGVSCFVNIWDGPEPDNLFPVRLTRGPHRPLIVLMRGVFGNLMPGNFVSVLNHLRRRGARALRVRTYTASAIEASGARLYREVSAELEGDDEVIWLCQSRGGVDALWALTQHPDLRARTAGVILVQTPTAPSAVMESILTDRHVETIARRGIRTVEKMQKAILSLPAFNEGCHHLIAPKIDEYVEAIQHHVFQFPILSVATWSLEPTSWVDSFHKRLGEIRPGCAHDGQFFLEDQLWPATEQLVLGRIDHAQTVMGGRGFDPVRFWMTLLTLLNEHIERRGVTRSATRQTQSASDT